MSLWGDEWPDRKNIHSLISLRYSWFALQWPVFRTWQDSNWTNMLWLVLVSLFLTPLQTCEITAVLKSAVCHKFPRQQCWKDALFKTFAKQYGSWYKRRKMSTGNFPYHHTNSRHCVPRAKMNKFVGRNNAKRRKTTARMSKYKIIYCQYFVLPCRTSSGLLYDSYIKDSDMYNDLNRRGYMWLVRYDGYAGAMSVSRLGYKGCVMW